MASLTKLSTGILQEKAAASLASGSYKVTQEIYKILLKRENKPRYRQGLADCYMQRARLSAEQGKYQEAITFWENHRDYSDTQEVNEHYVCWLLKAGQVAKLKAYLQNLNSECLEKDYPQLALLLGFVHLGGKIDLLQWLPENTAFTLQTHAMQQALAALQHNDLALMQRHLAKIPFRSVYRDFRTVLKAVSLLCESPEKASALLAKITPDSLYYPLGRLIAVLLLNGPQLTEALLALPQQQQLLICKAKDWTPQQIKLLRTLSRQKHLSDKIKFDLAIQYQTLLGADYAQRFCLAFLVEYPAGQRQYNKAFGTLPAFEKWRILALAAEAKNNMFEALDYWDQGLEQLHTNKQHNALKIALILRHMTNLCPASEVIAYLLESLEYDPEDRGTHLQIIKLYEQQGEKKQCRKSLEKALALFPGDIEFLGLAMQAAIINQAFKKAAQYADKILRIDPVNTQAKQVLFNSHLNHARKLLNSKKFHLVAKEIKHAEGLNLGRHYPALAQILNGFFIYMSEDQAQGAELIEKGLKLSTEGDFITRFRIINEALLLQIPLGPLLRKISTLEKNYSLSNQELNAFIKLLEEQHKENNSALIKTLDQLKKEFKSLLKNKQLKQEQLLDLMQCLNRINHFELMRHCLSCAKDIKSSPAWGFYKIYITALGKPAAVPPFGIQKLQQLYVQAKDQGQQRSAVLISTFLEKILHYHHIKIGNDDYFEDQEDDFYDPYEAIFEQLDSRTIAKVHRKIENLYKSLAEDQLIMSLIEMLPDKKDIPLLLKDEDLIDALLFLKAAQELNLEISITATELLAIAKQNNETSFPFPF